MKKKIYSYIFIALFFIVLLAVAVYSLVLPDTEYSDSEQRELASYPTYPYGADPEAWTAEVDQYLADQFPFREQMISRYHKTALQGGNSVVQEVYVLDSDYLFQFTYPTEEARTMQLAEKLRALSDTSGIPVVYTIVPQKNVSIAENVDGLENTTNLLNAQRTKEKLAEAQIPCIDLCDAFLGNFNAAERSDFYYKTDFHWNDKGAYEAAKVLAGELAGLGYLKEEELPKTSDFSWTDFTEDKSYLGDLQKRFSEEPYEDEYIPYYELRDQSGLHYFTELYGGETERSAVIGSGLSGEILEYNGVCTYNLGYIRIENEHASSALKVLVLKDSYQNAMTEYLSGMFRETVIVDPRAAKNSISELTAETDFDLILCIYHESNISKELLSYLK